MAPQNTESLADWLNELGLGRYVPVFDANQVDFGTLLILTDKDLEELGLPFGPRKRLLTALADLKGSESTAGPVPVSTPAPATGERRQLTVMFCDIVGFTELASRVDPEVLQGIVRRYEDTCTLSISRYEGYVFQRLGDGIVAFFGFPLAHEGEAERAIRAGLDIIDTLRKVEMPEVGRLEVRIGVASGEVVMMSRERGAVGETMNLAARLQSLAEPGAIAVSERVYRLAGQVFEYADTGEHQLKGLGTRTRVYRVLGLNRLASRFDATHARLTPMVGREQETARLLERWARAREGKGQVVLISGEPGIGKSRTLRAIREPLEAEGVPVLRFQCSPYHTNTPFHPFIDHLERVLGFSRDEPVRSRREKLEALVAATSLRSQDHTRYLASMLSIPWDDRPLAVSPRRQKEETRRAIVDLIEAAARTRPVLVLFEDVHWTDPTTLEVLDLLVARAAASPLFILLTHRPEFEPRWTELPHVMAITLGGLSRPQCTSLVLHLTGGKPLPPELLDQIIEKTDGVPLFLEELTKAILESGDLRDDGPVYSYARASATVAVPPTLRDSLMARLDRVAAVKEIAQIGAAFGREFTYDLVAAVASMSIAALDVALARLTASGLASQRGEIPNAVFTFKHALVQDAAYDSMLKSRRQQLHGQIARLLEERWPEARSVRPELLARHYTSAGLNELAVQYWRRAGDVALKRSALSEAITHLRKGLSLLATLPASRERDLEELGLRSMLGPAVVAQRGWAQPEVGAILVAAWKLAESLEHRPSYLPILNALWVHHLCLDRLALSLQWAERLLTSDDDSVRIAGHRATAASYFWLGQFTAAREHGDRIRASYDPERHWHIAQLTNTDPLTGDGIYRGQYLWMLGYPDQAVAASDEKDEHARRRNHPFDLAFALTLGAQVFDFLYEPDPLLRRTEEAERVGRQHGVPLLSEVLAEISKGIAWLRAGYVRDSIGQLRDSTARLSATGHRIWIGYLNALLAEAVALDGDPDAALKIVSESVERIEAGEERSHYAEVLRLKGWILMQLRREAEADRMLRRAIQVARRQQARSWELRATTTLARLLQQRGDPRAARELLEPIYGWFTEGFGTKDLREAKAVLETLQLSHEAPP